MAVRIRSAVENDAEAVAEIHGHYVRKTLATFTTLEKPLSLWRVEIAKGAPFFVAEADGSVTGYGTFGPFRSGPGYAHTAEHSVYVAPGGEGRGVGRALVAVLEQAAICAGIEVLVAGISSANQAAVAFHERLGYVEAGRVLGAGRKHGNTLDLVLMQKNLTQCGVPD